MAAVRVHLDHFGIEKIEIVPNRGRFSDDSFELLATLRRTIQALDKSVRVATLGGENANATHHTARA